MNENSKLQEYARPGAWNDPDLLQGVEHRLFLYKAICIWKPIFCQDRLGTDIRKTHQKGPCVEGTGKGSNDKKTNPSGCYDPATMHQTVDWYQTVEQAKAQFQFWALMSSPLLIAADPGQVEPELIEYWCGTKRTHTAFLSRVWPEPVFSNHLALEVLRWKLTSNAVSAGATRRLSKSRRPSAPAVRADHTLSKPKTHFYAKTSSGQTGTRETDAKRVRLLPGPYQAARVVGGDLTFQKARTTTSHGKPVLHKAHGSGSNVWAKMLPDGAFALGFVSNEDVPTDVTCDAACFGVIFAGGWANTTDAAAVAAAAVAQAAPPSLSVRDLWLHKDMPPLKPPFTLTAHALPPNGGVQMFRLAPPSK